MDESGSGRLGPCLRRLFKRGTKAERQYRREFVMNQDSVLPRSPELMAPGDTALLVIDVQERLLPAIRDRDRLVWNIRRLIDAAKILNVAVAATEQYPKGLGATAAVLAERLGPRTEKLMFSCRECTALVENWRQTGIHRILLCGIETHVCVQQTALDLLGLGFRVYVATDAVGSRYECDYWTALRRMELSGAVLTTTESAMFEWCIRAGTPEFREISRLAKEPPPSEVA